MDQAPLDAKDAFAELVATFFGERCEGFTAMAPRDPRRRPTTFCGWLAGRRIAVRASYWPHRWLDARLLEAIAARLLEATGTENRVIMCNHEVGGAARATLPRGVTVVDRYAVPALIEAYAPHLREAAWAAIAALPPDRAALEAAVRSGGVPTAAEGDARFPVTRRLPGR